MKLNEAALRMQRQLTAEARDHDANAEECRRLIGLLKRRGAAERHLEMEALIGIAHYHRVQSLKKDALAGAMQSRLGR